MANAEVAGEFSKHRYCLWTAGIFSIILGLLAIAFPIGASIGVEMLIGLLLMAFGATELVRAFWLRQTRKIIGTALLGALSLAAGSILLFFPASGLFSLTVLLIVYFFAAGVLKLISAFQLQPHPAWRWTAISGLLSISLGFLLSIAMPESALWVLGLFFGIDLLFFGAAQIALANARAP